MKTYVFYISGPNASGDHEEEYTEEELGIDETTTEEQEERLLNEAFNDFFSNIDHGRYIKK